ncbi:cyclin-T2 isoform X1 [Patella vulgata]|uniref:cyclin-T2 isoform X1 n=2 Tax=Patella vulgata TaxID=6465 RepID=UPI00217F4788|nr:cyclin-T2 isoform X1 [Patella vulgata]
MAGERWTFSKSQLLNTPSRKCGIDTDKELSYRQQAANLIQDMGQRLQTNQLCINTAIVYMHRFYMFHSFTKFNRNVMSPACLFLAAKVEEQPRKLEHVIRTSHSCQQREGTLDTKSETYLEYAQELIINENILLQTLGFEVRVDHPHTTVVTTCQLVRASKDLAQTSYFLATNSLHLTTMCLQHKPNVVACVCIHLACKWSGYEIPSSHEGKSWFSYVDRTVTMELLEELTQDFLNILDKCPSRLKKKIMVWKSGKGGAEDDKLSKSEAGSSSKGESSKSVKQEGGSHSRNLFEDSQSIINETSKSSDDVNGASRSQSASSASTSRSEGKAAPHVAMTLKDYKHNKDYKERKEKERMSGGHHSQTSSSSASSSSSTGASNKSHGNGDVKRSHNQHIRADAERKATQSAYDGLHHFSREDQSKQQRPDVKRQHDSPLKMTIKSNKDDKCVNKSVDATSSKVLKRPHQSDNEMLDVGERYSKHRRSETHPLTNDSTGTINHSDLFLPGGAVATSSGGQNMYHMGLSQMTSAGNGGSDRMSKNKSYNEGTPNSDRSLWGSVKSSMKSPALNLNQHVKTPNSSSKKDRSIFSPPQPPSSHHSQHPALHLQTKSSLPPSSSHVLSAKQGPGNLNTSFDQSYPHTGHSGSYPHPQYMSNTGYNMAGTYPDNSMAGVKAMNTNGGAMSNVSTGNVNPQVLQAQIQHLIAQQEYQIQKLQTNHQPQPSMTNIFDMDLLDSDLGTMPPLPPPLPQSHAPQPPPPPPF